MRVGTGRGSCRRWGDVEKRGKMERAAVKTLGRASAGGGAKGKGGETVYQRAAAVWGEELPLKRPAQRRGYSGRRSRYREKTATERPLAASPLPALPWREGCALKDVRKGALSSDWGCVKHRTSKKWVDCCQRDIDGSPWRAFGCTGKRRAREGSRRRGKEKGLRWFGQGGGR